MLIGGLALGVLVALASTDPARAEATGIRIELDAPADCATAEAFYEHVRSRTERVRPVIEGEAGVRVVVRLTRVGPKVHGELRVIGEHGESDTRRVDGGTCTEVVEALSLTVALAVDPTARLAPPQSASPSPPPESPPPAQPPREPEPEPEPEPELEPELEPERPARALETRVGVAVLAMGQVTPYVSFGGVLSARFVMPWAAASSFGLGVTYLANDLFTSADHASIRSTLFQLIACPKRFGPRDVFTFEPCLTGLGGWLSASGRGIDTSSSVVRSYFALGGSLIGAAALGKGWFVELSAGFAIPLVRRRFVVAEPHLQVGQTPNISALGGVGLTYSF